jgi:hypothetical protein
MRLGESTSAFAEKPETTDPVISFPDSLLNATTFRSAKSLENVIQMLRKERDGHGTGH